MKRMVTKMFAAGALITLVAGFMLPSLACAQDNGQPSEWICLLPSGQYVNTVNIWWGYTAGGAEWACNNWISVCGNGGGCMATVASATTYTVQAGDTMDTIAAQFGVSLAALEAVNPQIPDPTNIEVGQVLNIPLIPSNSPGLGPNPNQNVNPNLVVF